MKLWLCTVLEIFHRFNKKQISNCGVLVQHFTEYQRWLPPDLDYGQGVQLAVSEFGLSGMPALAGVFHLAQPGQFNGALGGIRTHDLWLRRPTLYPAELRAHGR